MTLKEFFATQEHGSKAKMAKNLGISKTWLSLVINGQKLPSAALSVAISAYTKNKVTKKVLRPDIF
jgi:DNA-binding transcriptional regulator YdaS (Cro superfamily)